MVDDNQRQESQQPEQPEQSAATPDHGSGLSPRVMLIGAIVVFGALVAVGWFLLRPPSLPEALERAATVMADHVPMTLSEDITLREVSKTNDALVFQTYTENPETTLDAGRIAQVACRNESTLRILNLAGQVVYRLSMDDGTMLSEVVVSREDCARTADTET